MSGSGVINPGRRQNDDILSTVMKGLSIARDVYGLHADSEKLDMLQQQAADTKADRERLASGKLNKGELLDLGTKGMVPAKKGDAGALEYTDSGSGITGYVRKAKADQGPVMKTVSPGQSLLEQDPTTGEWKPSYTAPPKKGGEGGAKAPAHIQMGGKILEKDATGAWTPVYEAPADADKVDAKDLSAQRKRATDLADKINPSRGRAGELGRSQSRLNAADRVLALALDKDGNPRNLNKGEMTELAASVAAMVTSGSVASQHTIDAMTPQSLWGNIQAQEAFLTNNVSEADMQPFVARLADTAKREKEATTQHKVAAQVQTVAAYGDLRDDNPKLFGQVVRAAGLNPDDFDADMNYVPGSGARGPQFSGPSGNDPNADGKGNADGIRTPPGPAGAPAPRKVQPTPDDTEAIKWLGDHPNDALAPAVRAKLKAKGL